MVDTESNQDNTRRRKSREDHPQDIQLTTTPERTRHCLRGRWKLKRAALNVTQAIPLPNHVDLINVEIATNKTPGPGPVPNQYPTVNPNCTTRTHILSIEHNPLLITSSWCELSPPCPAAIPQPRLPHKTVSETSNTTPLGC